MSGSVCDQCGLLSVWQERASGSENHQRNAWEKHSQNLHMVIKVHISREKPSV